MLSRGAKSSPPGDAAGIAGAAVGRRRFVGALAATAGAVLAPGAVSAAAAEPTPRLPGEVHRLVRQTARQAIAYDEVEVELGGDRARLFVPHRLTTHSSGVDVLWLHPDGPRTDLRGSALSAAETAVESGAVAVCLAALANRAAAAAEQRQVRGFAYIAEQFPVAFSYLHAAGRGGVAASTVVTDRLIPRVGGLYLHAATVDPTAAPLLYWRGARVRAVTGTASPARDLIARITEIAEEATTTPVEDFAATLARWRERPA